MKEHSCKHCPSSCSHTALKCAWSHCRVALPEVPELKPAFLRNSLIWVGFHSGSAKHTSHPDHFVFSDSFNVVLFCHLCHREECNRKSTHAGFCVGNDKLVGALAQKKVPILGFTHNSASMKWLRPIETVGAGLDDVRQGGHSIWNQHCKSLRKTWSWVK